MDVKPLHTKVDKTIQTLYGTIVLENPNGFPRAECNLYCLTPDGSLVWQAEKPDSNTLYSRMKLNDDGATLSTYTLSGHACDLELATGKILTTTSIQ